MTVPSPISACEYADILVEMILDAPIGSPMNVDDITKLQNAIAEMMAEMGCSLADLLRTMVGGGQLAVERLEMLSTDVVSFVGTLPKKELLTPKSKPRPVPMHLSVVSGGKEKDPKP